MADTGKSLVFDYRDRVELSNISPARPTWLRAQPWLLLEHERVLNCDISRLANEKRFQIEWVDVMGTDGIAGLVEEQSQKTRIVCGDLMHLGKITATANARDWPVQDASEVRQTTERLVGDGVPLTEGRTAMLDPQDVDKLGSFSSSTLLKDLLDNTGKPRSTICPLCQPEVGRSCIQHFVPAETIERTAGAEVAAWKVRRFANDSGATRMKASCAYSWQQQS
ncbi:hypothetical protein EK21DRAFT_110807 [Setomelanomma holmii]|uniref:Uncharacterized protein n=1 Tax=Setomelanomma holmii TaxID=210430 RepID=A0A9P4HDN5_9PLEO|nr:hypothetical protein EK21DRAFT_110807 [Setomelanomma holmii]